MLNRLDSIIARVHEPKVKSLLEHIAQDEKRHHRILDEVNEILGWRDQTQEDWWNTVDRVEWTF
jgi:rubrerythrin